MARFDPKDAPYQASRAAFREAYGSRRIDASAPYSAKDSTPSGRRAYLESRGSSPVDAKQQVQDEFRANFQFRLADQMQPRMVSRRLIQNPNPNPPQAGQIPMQMGAIDQAMKAIKNPFGPVSFNLLPQVEPGSMLDFLPSPGTPLSGFGLPNSKPTRSIYG